MGKQSRRPTRRDRHNRDEDVDYAYLTGWCATEDELEECKKAAHDTLIRQLGTARRGPVAWKIADTSQAATVLGPLFVIADQAMSNNLREVRGKLREFGGFAVIAYAPGARS